MVVVGRTGRWALAASLVALSNACTMMIAGRKATVDGSTMTTQTNDCLDCDFRIGLIPRANHTKDETASIWAAQFSYPRYVGDDRGDMYGAEKLDKRLYSWGSTKTIGTVDQVEKTYQYLEGSYAMVNEKQLGFGESTCGAYFVSRPIYDGGHAMFDISALMRIAMERTGKAREAVQIMGELAEEYGFYGAAYEPDADGGLSGAQGEAGEALGVIDPQEAWMFHIAPDDTGASAVWVAQRLEDDQFAAVANQFTIRQVDLRDSDKFLGSSNLEEVARRGGIQVHGSLSDGTFDFTATYGVDSQFMSPYSTRRVWRLLSMVAPGLALPASTTKLADDYPFSVKPEEKLSAADLMRFMRDHYEGTEFDLTKGVAAGPYGDPSRFDISANAEGVTGDMVMAGRYERAISLFRTSYSFVVVCREALPDVVGAMVWVGYYAPHASVYVPFYPSASSTPDSFRTGSLFKLDRESTFWGHAAAGNYAARFYIHTIKEFQSMQEDLEGDFFKRQAQVESEVVEALKGGDEEFAPQHLEDFTNSCAKATHARVWDLLDRLIEKYHDGYEIPMGKAEKFVPTKLFYPLTWLQETGYFPADSVYAAQQQGGGYAAAVAGGGGVGGSTGLHSSNVTLGGGLLWGLAGACLGALGHFLYQRSSKYGSYVEIN